MIISISRKTRPLRLDSKVNPVQQRITVLVAFVHAVRAEKVVKISKQINRLKKNNENRAKRRVEKGKENK